MSAERELMMEMGYISSIYLPIILFLISFEEVICLKLTLFLIGAAKTSTNCQPKQNRL
jgi:hypothetical protein